MERYEMSWLLDPATLVVVLRVSTQLLGVGLESSPGDDRLTDPVQTVVALQLVAT